MYMTFNEVLRARVHRILKSLDRFQSLSGQSNFNHYAKEPAISEGEEVLGIYRPNAGDVDNAVIVTTLGLHVYSDEWICLEYSKMISAHVSLEDSVDKTSASILIIELETGKAIPISIAGGQGNLRDVWSFLRFLQRVIVDYHKRQ